MSSHTSLSSQIESLKAATLAATTVMGPDNADLCATIADDTELMAQLRTALTDDQLTGEQLRGRKAQTFWNFWTFLTFWNVVMSGANQI